jgi:hypothetical protein
LRVSRLALNPSQFMPVERFSASYGWITDTVPLPLLAT